MFKSASQIRIGTNFTNQAHASATRGGTPGLTGAFFFLAMVAADDIATPELNFG